jgi:hypothetical protein
MSNLSDTFVTSPVTLTTTSETTVATSPALTEGQVGPVYQGMRLQGVVNVTAGASTTAVVVRVRQGVGTGGALVGNAATHTLAATAIANVPFDVVDSAGVSGTALQWTVTVQQTAASGNGTVNQGSLSTILATTLP